MEKLKLMVDGQVAMLDADVKVCKGIYVASEAKIARKNIEKLQITFDPDAPDNVLQHKMTKIEKWSFLSSKAGDNYLQYIFMPSASQEDFNLFLREFADDPEMRELLTSTYNLSRMTINNLDALESLFKNRN